MSCELLEGVVAAYGGADLWRNSRVVEATISSGGLGFAIKWHRGQRRRRVSAQISRPEITIELARDGSYGILEEKNVRIESPLGRIVDSRRNADSFFPGGRRLFWWDRLDILYFRGEALWNYLTFPALLLRDDISWTQIFDNTLEGRFPSHLPTHCEVQRFHFDPASRLLRQHDYTAEAFGSSAKAANVVLEHKTWDAIPFPYKRRVTPRAPDGTPRGGPTLIWIEIDDWSIR